MATQQNDWKPLSLRTGARESSEVLHEGLPPHLRRSAYAWFERAVPGYDHQKAFLDSLEVRRRERILRSRTLRETLEQIFFGDTQDELALDALDFALADFASEPLTDDLRTTLSAGGSAWTVATDGCSLERRVLPAAATALANAAATAIPRAGDHLRGAWSAVYGRHPDPGVAYREAVKAVEAVLCPAILPKEPKSTLGKAIAALKAAPAKMEHVFANADAREKTIGLVELLWKNQTDRHGDPDAPKSVTQAQAEAAVQLAVLLVQWMSSDAVTIHAR